MNKHKKEHRIIKIAINGLVAYTTVSALLVVMSAGGVMDFPCSEKFVSEKECVETNRPEEDNAYRIQSFLTTYTAGWSGGGCLYSKSETDTLTIETSIKNVLLERDNDILRVDGKVLEKGSEFRYTNIFHWNSWIVSQIRFKNTGLVTYCRSVSKNERIIVIGRFGTKVSLLKGLSILTIPILVLTYFNRSLKKRISQD